MANKQARGFTLYDDLFPIILTLEDNKAGELFKATISYFMKGECKALQDRTSEALFSTLKGYVDQSKEKACKKQEQTSAAGHASWEARKERALNER